MGKTTVADLVGAPLGAVRLSIDPVEEALIDAGFSHGWKTGVAAYEAVREMAELNLRTGRTVVVDAVNDSEPARETWRRAADSANAALCWIVLTMSDTIGHKSRLHNRDRGFTHIGEPAWAEVTEREIAPWTDTRETIDVSGMSAEQIAADIERYVVEFRFNV
ncbi:ATP-binding protein [Microbacterium aerolatum]|nr:ATP-binding protein [Microbacterium aerolatum]